ncbi:Protein FAM65B [Hypsibius exemplaris]|uniref:Protein FAM65B n=1 Tax=Hypsibius exemplaris TaxID=2072580 RepID=A0A1W0WBU9_HYPEX|nr:Protein FAM65B [Hypsibius exemplaris]
MSLTDRRRAKLLPELPEGNGISRSKSFAGFLNRTISRRESMNPTTGNPLDYRMRMMQRATAERGGGGGGGSVKNAGKAPKTPRPLRALTIVDTLRTGLRECIALTVEDMKGLTGGGERMLMQSSQQLKSADRYLKRLELQLNKLEELGDSYNVQHRLREGVRNMAQAYMASGGKEREAALGKVKAGYKECSQNMCALEAQLESLMGSLEMRMKGIAGFARLCPGDTFEIVVRHGGQKWKSRGHVNKDATQTWDRERIVFKSLFGDILHVKASEVRTLGNRTIVGNKHCETKDLFSAHPQVMTISLNSNGSLKLNLVISWNPLDGTTEEATWSPWMLKTPSTEPPHSISRTSEISAPAESLPVTRSVVHHEETSFRRSLSSTVSSGADRQSSVSPKTEASNAGSMSPSNLSASGSNLNTLDNVIRALVTSVKELQGQYPQLLKLERHILRLEKLLMPDCRMNGRMSRGSDLSISIESALDAFDFLNDVEEEDRERESHAQKTNTVDSGIESLEERLGSTERDRDGRHVTSGSDQLDLALLQHLFYCDTLLESLGAYGPLKQGESRALRHLLTQGDILEILVKLVEDPMQIDDFTTLMRDITEKQRLHLLWEQCAGGHYLCTSADSVVTQLKARYVHFFKTFTETERQDVLELLICQLLDRPAYDPAAIVTLFHFLFFLKADDHWEVEALLLKFHNDLRILGSLQSRDAAHVVETLQSLRGRPVDAAYAIQISVCLLSPDQSVRDAAENFLQTSLRENALRSWMLRTYATALEDERTEIRRAACVALRILGGSECMQELLHVVQSDPVVAVSEEAKQSVLSFGEDGNAEIAESDGTGDTFERFNRRA